MNRNLYLGLIKKIGLGFVFALYLSLSPGSAYANSSSCPVGTTMNFVAHEDDDMLFLNPDIQNDIHAGRCVITVYLTAGDAGLSTTYWQNRENGEKASYSIMSSALNLWTQQDAGITAHPIPVFTLTTAPNRSLIFLRLPDGNNDGLGFASTNYQTLQKLWQGNIPTITAINNSSSYTKQDLINTLLKLMNTYKPDIIRTQNFVDSYNSAVDHSDHYTTAYLTQAASQVYSTSHILIGYYDYEIDSKPQNIFVTDVTAKENTFISYAKYDPNVCQTLSACLADPRYGGWFLREYTIATITPTPTLSPTPTPTATPTATPTPTPAGGTQLLTGPWTFSGNNGSAEKNTSIPVTSLFGMTYLLAQFNLHGSIFGKADDEASIVFVQNNDWYLSLNGQYVCGLPLSQMTDSLLPPGQIGVLVTVDKDPAGKLGVSFSKVTLNALAQSGSAATPVSTP